MPNMTDMANLQLHIGKRLGHLTLGRDLTTRKRQEVLTQEKKVITGESNLQSCKKMFVPTESDFYKIAGSPSFGHADACLSRPHKL